MHRVRFYDTLVMGYAVAGKLRFPPTVCENAVLWS